MLKDGENRSHRPTEVVCVEGHRHMDVIGNRGTGGAISEGGGFAEGRDHWGRGFQDEAVTDGGGGEREGGRQEGGGKGEEEEEEWCHPVL